MLPVGDAQTLVLGSEGRELKLEVPTGLWRSLLEPDKVMGSVVQRHEKINISRLHIFQRITETTSSSPSSMRFGISGIPP